MKICPGCQRTAKVSERIEVDKKTAKHWLITFCARCGYNYELDEYTDRVLSPQDEMGRIKWPEKRQWPLI